VSEPKVHKAILEVMLALKAVEKSHKNEAQGYKFRGIDDMLNHLHGLMASAGLFVVPEVLEQNVERTTSARGAPQIHYYSRVKHTFMASDGSSISAITAGEGLDTSDKAMNKAHSASLKYALIEVFCVPTEDIEEGDRTSPQVEPKEEPKQELPPAPLSVPKQQRKPKQPSCPPPGQGPIEPGDFPGGDDDPAESEEELRRNSLIEQIMADSEKYGNEFQEAKVAKILSVCKAKALEDIPAGRLEEAYAWLRREIQKTKHK